MSTPHQNPEAPRASPDGDPQNNRLIIGGLKSLVAAAGEMVVDGKERAKIIIGQAIDPETDHPPRSKYEEDIRTSVPSKGNPSVNNPSPEAPKAAPVRTRRQQRSKEKAARRHEKRADSVSKRVEAENLLDVEPYRDDRLNRRSVARTERQRDRQQNTANRAARKSRRVEDGTDLPGLVIRPVHDLRRSVSDALLGDRGKSENPQNQDETTQITKVPDWRTPDGRVKIYETLGVKESEQLNFDNLVGIRIKYREKEQAKALTRQAAIAFGKTPEQIEKIESPEDLKELSELQKIDLKRLIPLNQQHQPESVKEEIIKQTKEGIVISSVGDSRIVLENQRDAAAGAVKYRLYQERTRDIFEELVDKKRRKQLKKGIHEADIPEIVKKDLLEKAESTALHEIYF